MWKERRDVLCLFLPKDLVLYKILPYYPSYDREHYQQKYKEVLTDFKVVNNKNKHLFYADLFPNLRYSSQLLVALNLFHKDNMYVEIRTIAREYKLPYAMVSKIIGYYQRINVNCFIGKRQEKWY